jgi:hypothetical protein
LNSFKQSTFDISNFDVTSKSSKKNWDGITIDTMNITEYLTKHFDVINPYTINFIVLECLLGNGGFGNVNIKSLLIN